MAETAEVRSLPVSTKPYFMFISPSTIISCACEFVEVFLNCRSRKVSFGTLAESESSAGVPQGKCEIAALRLLKLPLAST